MALVQSSSLMTLGLKGDRGMARHNSVPSLGSKPAEFKFGRPDYAVRKAVWDCQSLRCSAPVDWIAFTLLVTNESC